MKWKYFAVTAFLFAMSALSVARDGNSAWMPPVKALNPSAITVLLDARDPLPDGIVLSLEEELRRVFFGTVTPVNLVIPDLDAHPQFDTEVLVTRVTGTCKVEAMPPLHAHKPDTLGRTLVTDGRILPFIELDCRQISGAVRKELVGRTPPERTKLLGRALARVLAHEIYHVLGQTHRHGPSGIAAECLSSQDLVRDRLDFRFEELEQMGLVTPMGTH